MTKLIFRGTGDSMGVPRVYCDCEVCSEARSADGGINRRLRSLVQIEETGSGTTLIDCGPDWGKQMEAASLRTVDQILLTHAHFDHIGGLVEWADACRWLGKSGQAFAPAEVIAEINERFPWLQRQIHFTANDEPMELGSWRISCWRVNHGKNGYSYAYRFDHLSKAYSWVYCSDAIGLTEDQQKPLYGLDLLVLGTSFYKENFAYETRSVYDVTEAMDLIKLWKPRQVYFTHMSHDIDLRRDYGLPSHLRFAEAGLEIGLEPI
ncbi:MBL fold metallo-hydrolase [Paenibacillus radicis (ex Gao et al. 2016)]|uniref:MBL fold metallo-hydrolase n=1 Tax=Paenibacillus radicis (ex Gao et al. 2016) TaxID=1737354 RepID=A0A917MAL1_9BACL|nr:MBL fold metallo-hydrolase [Paenibacillus radicis (ex Gao et al. 2016)]GGG88194.1 MBL fold metallo-hydrolase [Paenibacillus radicis (ex Gao et al. 2016)]